MKEGCGWGVRHIFQNTLCGDWSSIESQNGFETKYHALPGVSVIQLCMTGASDDEQSSRNLKRQIDDKNWR